MFRALLAHPQEALPKRHLVHCVRVMSVGRIRTGFDYIGFTTLITVMQFVCGLYCAVCLVVVLYSVPGCYTVQCVWLLYCTVCLVVVLYSVSGCCTVQCVWLLYCSVCLVVLYSVSGCCTVQCVWLLYCTVFLVVVLFSVSGCYIIGLLLFA
jgi:hypothetical protein